MLLQSVEVECYTCLLLVLLHLKRKLLMSFVWSWTLHNFFSVILSANMSGSSHYITIDGATIMSQPYYTDSALHKSVVVVVNLICLFSWNMELLLYHSLLHNGYTYPMVKMILDNWKLYLCIVRNILALLVSTSLSICCHDGSRKSSYIKGVNFKFMV